MVNTKALNVLSLDSGGLRGLSELYILESLMAQLHAKLDLDEDVTLRPCEVFDLICGTSIGGINALLLGRLGLTTRQAIDAYQQLFRLTFPATATQRDLQIDGQNQSPDTPMRDPQLDPRCRVFVTSTYGANLTVSTNLRSYKVTQPVLLPAFSRSIWEAARATTATALFPPITFDNTVYVDGGMSSHCNNPTKEAIAETKRIWGQDSEIGCLVSLGSGEQPPVSLNDPNRSLLELMKKIVDDCGAVAKDVLLDFHVRGKEEHYHRFTAHPYATISLEEWKEAETNNIVGLTRAYLESQPFALHKAAQALLIGYGHAKPGIDKA
ncbi:FabD/lysophospholipase-like protein [Atractiella rhizophila]|nr:FabD/lysophospholipase-like protein [Atractiella rhizophila]